MLFVKLDLNQQNSLFIKWSQKCLKANQWLSSFRMMNAFIGPYWCSNVHRKDYFAHEDLGLCTIWLFKSVGFGVYRYSSSASASSWWPSSCFPLFIIQCLPSDVLGCFPTPTPTPMCFRFRTSVEVFLWSAFPCCLATSSVPLSFKISLKFEDSKTYLLVILSSLLSLQVLIVVGQN